jgi:hypothetical protein
MSLVDEARRAALREMREAQLRKQEEHAHVARILAAHPWLAEAIRDFQADLVLQDMIAVEQGVVIDARGRWVELRIRFLDQAVIVTLNERTATLDGVPIADDRLFDLFKERTKDLLKRHMQENDSQLAPDTNGDAISTGRGSALRRSIGFLAC